jgi:hypothetical protein
VIVLKGSATLQFEDCHAGDGRRGLRLHPRKKTAPRRVDGPATANGLARRPFRVSACRNWINRRLGRSSLGHPARSGMTSRRSDDLAGVVVDPFDVIEACELIAQVADVVGRAEERGVWDLRSRLWSKTDSQQA